MITRLKAVNGMRCYSLPEGCKMICNSKQARRRRRAHHPQHCRSGSSGGSSNSFVLRF